MSVRMKVVLSSCSGGGFTSAMKTCHSRARRCLVRARPMPEEAPVTIAVAGAMFLKSVQRDGAVRIGEGRQVKCVAVP